MAAKKGQQKTPGSGRKKGTPNKATANVREAIEMAFAGIGGVEAFSSWAKENQTEFYKLYSKLLPLQVSGEVDGNITISWEE